MQIVHQDSCSTDTVAWAEELAALRRDIHSHPELGFDTAGTVERIVRTLRGWGLAHVDAQFTRNGVIAVIEGNEPGPTIAFRADIDALPMEDCSDNAWKSQVPGCSHACGHDGHQTWLMGTLRYLHEHRDFPGRVVGIFQPAEEIGGGALSVIESGVFEMYGIREIYGAHTEPMLPKGVMGFHAGPLQASNDFFSITVHGVGTHGGRPHLGVDPIPVGAQIVSALQTLVSRKIDPVEPAVLSICSFIAGRAGAYNVIPHVLTIGGTVRTYSPDVRNQIEATMKQIVEGTAAASGCMAEFEYNRVCPSVINAPEQTEFARSVAVDLFGASAACDIRPFMSSEDFAEYLHLVPGCMIRIGVKDETHAVSVHNQAFDFNDEVLPEAVTLFGELLIRRLRALA